MDVAFLGRKNDRATAANARTASCKIRDELARMTTAVCLRRRFRREHAAATKGEEVEGKG